MYKIKNEVLQEKVEGTEEIKTQYFINVAAGFIAQGATVVPAEQRLRIRIMDAVEKQDGKKNIDLEDQDFDKLKQLAEAVQWTVINKKYIDFCDMLAKLKKS